MSQAYTLVTVDHGAGERYEALYSGGRLIAEPDGGGAFSASGLLDAIASDNVGIQPEYVEVTLEYDERVLAMGGWPASLDEIPKEARVDG